MRITTKMATLLLSIMLFSTAIFCGCFAESEDLIEYNVESLAMTISMPKDWKTYTPNMTKDDPIWEGDEDLHGEIIGNMTAGGLSLASYAMDRNQHSIFVRTYENASDTEDYSEYFMWELRQIAKASCIANDYLSYDVIETAQTRYLAFDYSGVDSGDTIYEGILYHTVVNGKIIEIDFSSYNSLDEHYTELFYDAVDSISYQIDETVRAASNHRVKSVLTIVALCVLAVALVVVIVLYIVSQIKKSKKMKEAVVAADALKTEHDAILGIDSDADLTDDAPPAAGDTPDESAQPISNDDWQMPIFDDDDSQDNN